MIILLWCQDFQSNKGLLQGKNESVVVQRISFDSIQHDGGYVKVNISQDMLRHVRHSLKAYENRGKLKLKSKNLRKKDCQLN